jgi:hypothetical protein
MIIWHHMYDWLSIKLTLIIVDGRGRCVTCQFLKCSLGVRGPTIRDPNTKCDCNLGSEFNQLA